MSRVRALAPLLLVAAALVAASGAAAQGLPDDPDLQEPYLAWDRGDYPEAMRGYLRVLDGPRGAELKDRVARLTGELHPVMEIAPDGSGLAMGPDGRAATFRVVERGVTVTKVVAMPQGTVTATVPSAITALLGDGLIAYTRVRVTPDVDLARRAFVQTADPAERLVARSRLQEVEARASDVVLRTIADGRERVVPAGGWAPLSLTAVDGTLLALALSPSGDRDVVVLAAGEARPLGTTGVRALLPVPGGRWVVGVAGARLDQVLLIDRQGGATRRFAGRRAPAVSADGSTLAMVGREGGAYTLEVLHPDRESEPRVLVRSDRPIDRPAVSPSGALIAYQRRPAENWEVFTIAADEGVEPGDLNLTREIQHDRMPIFLGAGTVLAVKGEARHYRSYVYDRVGSEPLELFHNNTLRTIAPEYEWVATPDGAQVLIVAERDGDTVSPERGVYMVDRTRGIGRGDLRARLESNLTRELDLRARGSRAFLPIGDAVRQRVEEVSTARIYAHAETLDGLGSKYIGTPGNAAAADYLVDRLREFGYQPEQQAFETREGPRTANVVARLEGTEHPELVYTVSSHFDSVEEGPGADDNSSGTTALLEAARVLAEHPQPATIEFAFFSGEEAGLLGAVEYVRRALAQGKRIQGALNNDMVGWTNDHRLDNTVRYSNPGIRDVQHAAAIFYGGLITYDALYYKNTDAHALFDGFGDVIGGIGSHPVLGNPNYHQPTDRLATVNQALVTAVSRTTVASVMLLASSPARLRGLTARTVAPPQSDELELTWAPALERDVAMYVVRWTDRLGALREDRVAGASRPPPETRLDSLRIAIGAPVDPGARPTIRLRGVRPGSAVSVKAINARGLEGWDWATVQAP